MSLGRRSVPPRDQVELRSKEPLRVPEGERRFAERAERMGVVERRIGRSVAGAEFLARVRRL